jgi:hypothetical protein
VVAETGGNPLALLELGTAFEGKPLPPDPLVLWQATVRCSVIH